MSEAPEARIAPPALQDDTVLVASGRQTTADLGGASAVLNLDTKVYYTVEGTALRIWEALAQPTSVRALVERLVARYEVEPARCRREVLAFLEQLLAQGLVEVR